MNVGDPFYFYVGPYLFYGRAESMEMHYFPLPQCEVEIKIKGHLVMETGDEGRGAPRFEFVGGLPRALPADGSSRRAIEEGENGHGRG